MNTRWLTKSDLGAASRLLGMSPDELGALAMSMDVLGTVAGEDGEVGAVMLCRIGMAEIKVLRAGGSQEGLVALFERVKLKARPGRKLIFENPPTDASAALQAALWAPTVTYTFTKE